MLMTQIGFVRSTVKEPARRPASIDSSVVSAVEGREVRRAARVKKVRVHSYPVGRGWVGQ